MGLVNLPIGATNSGTNDWSDVHGEDQAIVDVVNGNIEAANLASNAVTTAKITDANVTDAKLASPNNSVYRTLLVAHGYATADAGAATYALTGTDVRFTSGSLAASGGMLASGGNLLDGSGTTSVDFSAAPNLIYFDDADFTVASKTQKLRLRAQVNTNTVAWSSVTATFGLYPVTFAGGNDTLTMTLGTVVAGSTVVIANPSASTTNQGNSGDFTIPSDGQYCVGVVLSAQLTNNAVSLLTAQLQHRNV